jgi:Na+/phosphate symporter
VPYPEQALAACVQELRREGAMTREMLERALDGMVSLDRRNFAVIERLEESVGSIREEMNEYLHLVGGRRLSPRQVLMLQHVARMASALKRTGDHIRHLVDLCHRKFDERLWFDDDDMRRLLELSLRASRMLALTMDSLDPYQPDQEAVAKEILAQRRDYRIASKATREAFNATLPEEGGEGRSALMYIHFVTIFDKIVSHLKEIARQESNWSWRLRESKLVVLEPEATPHPTTPEGAIIDRDYKAAVERILRESPVPGVGEPDPDT